MIGEFERGQKFRCKQESAIFDTSTDTHESETGLYISHSQIWEVDGYNDVLDRYIFVCKKSAIALKLSKEDINALFDKIESADAPYLD